MGKLFEKTFAFAFAACLTAFFAAPLAGAEKDRILPMLNDGDEIRCAGEYAGHVQGIATDGKTIYWSFTSAVVRTDLNGKILAKHPLAIHGGDPCFADGKLYVPLGTKFSQEPRKEKKHKAGKNKKPDADNFVLVLDPDLKPLRTIPLAGFKYGAGGIACRNGRFYIVGGRPRGRPGNTIHEYSADFKPLRRIEIDFNSVSGIQTINFASGGRCFLGCYGVGNFVTELDGKWRVVRRPRPNFHVGAIPLGGELFLVVRALPGAKGRSRAMAKVRRLKSAHAPKKK